MRALQVTPTAWEEIAAVSPLLCSPGAGLGYAERLPVSHLQLPAAGWRVVQSTTRVFFASRLQEELVEGDSQR